MRRILLPLAALAILSCNQNHPSTQQVTLHPTALFNRDSVSAFLSTAPGQQLDSSKQAFRQGIDLLKNNNNPTGAIALLQQSLAWYPTANAYFELGNAYLETKKWPLALQAFGMAEALDYKPLGNVFYKQASCYAEMDSINKMLDYITYAVQNGFVDKQKITSDMHFANYKRDYMLLNAYNEAMSGNGDPDELLWRGYSQSFQQARFPVTVDSGALRRMAEAETISYDYEKFVPEMRDNKFSRDVGSEYFYVARILQTELCHVVLYGCRSYEEVGAPDYFILASFDPKGKLVDKMIVSGAKTFDENHKVFTAKNKTSFQVDEYRNEYEKDSEEYGYEENKIVSRVLVATKQFQVDASGKFIAAQQS
ncbi:tetratricopeptide repeat protein [Flavisolibacter sp. BT320]|nr:tetratricopeptide repeat protein [Flavisolibacter longurius]